MRRILHQRTVTLWAVLLLVLAISPVTAPFSPCNLKDLLSERDAHPGAILQSKTVQDPSVPGLSSSPVTALQQTATGRLPVVRAPSGHRQDNLQIPLRI